MNAQTISYEQIENGYKMLVVCFIMTGMTKDEANLEATKALKNGDFESMVKSAICQ